MFANYQKNLLKHLISGTKQRISDLLLLFKRGASEAAEGCLMSVAAKLVKTATKILTLILQYTCAWK